MVQLLFCSLLQLAGILVHTCHNLLVYTSLVLLLKDLGKVSLAFHKPPKTSLQAHMEVEVAKCY